MPFSVTDDEKRRVELAASMGLQLDPIDTSDLWMIVAISAVYAVGLLAVVFLLWNRKYPPLKSKNPLLMGVAFVSCVFWFLGDLQINGHVHLASTGLTNCRGVGVWLRVLLGVCTVSSLLALRSYGLFRVFRQNRSYSGLGFYLPFLIYCSCTLVYGIVAQALPAHVTVEYIPMLDMCYCPKPFRAALYGYIWATWLLIAIINWRIRNIKSSFNESREMAFSCALVFAILTFSTALQFARPEYPLSQVLRILSTSMDHLVTNVVWWAIMGVPLFNCLFRRTTYLEYWLTKLHKDGLQHEYDVKSSLYHGTVDSNLSDDGFFLFSNDAGPEYLPNGDLRPISRKQPSTFLRSKRQSTQTARFTRSVFRPPHQPNPADPFDITPATSPRTASARPSHASDPFHGFSSGPPNHHAVPVYTQTPFFPTEAVESQSVVPRLSSTIPHGSL